MFQWHLMQHSDQEMKCFLATSFDELLTELTFSASNNRDKETLFENLVAK